MVSTHRDYFRKFDLSVEQYGEILVATAFHGKKLGDVQHGYDIDVCYDQFIAVLGSIAVPLGQFGLASNENIKIEVKSKLHKTKAGKATVVHCNEGKIVGMTHLVVIIVNSGCDNEDEKGNIQSAWLLSTQKAEQLRKKEGKTQYIRASQLHDAANAGIIDIVRLLEQAATTTFAEL